MIVCGLKFVILNINRKLVFKLELKSSKDIMLFYIVIYFLDMYYENVFICRKGLVECCKYFIQNYFLEIKYVMSGVWLFSELWNSYYKEMEVCEVFWKYNVFYVQYYKIIVIIYVWG